MAQLVERGIENLDRNFDANEKEKELASELYEQFITVGGCETLMRELEDAAEEFFRVVYPSEDFRVVGRPKFTFDFTNVRFEGSYSHNRDISGVNKSTFQKVSLILPDFFVYI